MSQPEHRTRGRARSAAWVRWTVPALVVLAWLAIAGFGGPYAGKLSEVQSNDNASFLPTNAESTQVLRLQRKFTGKQTDPALVVYVRASGITPRDMKAAAADARRLDRSSAVVDRVVGPLPSKDGKAIELVVPLSNQLGSSITDVVNRIRSQAASRAPTGLATYVTGPAGLAADFVNAFSGIDGILLGVAVLGVLIILALVYRSPILPFVVLISSMFALAAASVIVYVLADNGLITLNGQTQGILFVIVVGAATDYALLLVSRFREELREQVSRFDAMRRALRQSSAPIVASGSTVILGLLCLLVSSLNSTRGLGPVGAIGIVCSLLAALTFLPAALVLLGRAAFWPLRPHYGSEHSWNRGIWDKLSRLIARRPRRVWLITAGCLVAAAAFLPTFRAGGTPQSDVFLSPQPSVQGQTVADRHFPAGTAAPAVIVGPADRLGRITTAVRSVPGVASVSVLTTRGPGAPGGPPKVVNGLAEVQATLRASADSQAAEDTVTSLRDAVHRAAPTAKVGGFTAIQLDTLSNSRRDLYTIIPIVLAVIALVLCLLLRAVVAPILLMLSVVLSFAATLGVSALVFNHALGFAGADPAVPLYAFVFLVALGIDYNIFLMTRVREESVHRGTKEGTLRGLAVTGGVITSAGIVLAATFSALAVIPLIFLAQMAFIVAFGVLLDTFIVRSLLVPAVSYDIGDAIWWPGRLSRGRMAS